MAKKQRAKTHILDKTKKLPKFNSDAEIAAFWDTHDFTDYPADIKPADDVIFERKPKIS